MELVLKFCYFLYHVSSQNIEVNQALLAVYQKLNQIK